MPTVRPKFPRNRRYCRAGLGVRNPQSRIFLSNLSPKRRRKTAQFLVSNWEQKRGQIFTVCIGKYNKAHPVSVAIFGPFFGAVFGAEKKEDLRFRV